MNNEKFNLETARLIGFRAWAKEAIDCFIKINEKQIRNKAEFLKNDIYLAFALEIGMGENDLINCNAEHNYPTLINFVNEEKLESFLDNLTANELLVIRSVIYNAQIDIDLSNMSAKDALNKEIRLISAYDSPYKDLIRKNNNDDISVTLKSIREQIKAIGNPKKYFDIFNFFARNNKEYYDQTYLPAFQRLKKAFLKSFNTNNDKLFNTFLNHLISSYYRCYTPKTFLGVERLINKQNCEYDKLDFSLVPYDVMIANTNLFYIIANAFENTYPNDILAKFVQDFPASKNQNLERYAKFMAFHLTEKLIKSEKQFPEDFTNSAFEKYAFDYIKSQNKKSPSEDLIIFDRYRNLESLPF